MFVMFDPKPIKINDAPASYKSAMCRSFGFGIDESMRVVKREETVCNLEFNREFAAHMTKTEPNIFPTHWHKVLFTLLYSPRSPS